MLIEYWKPIPGYIGLYEVSSFGRVRSLDRLIDNHRGVYIKKGRILKLSVTTCGYIFLHLYKDGSKKMFLVHRLVWLAFNGTVPEGLQVNHINEDKTDNRLENLNLMTPKENMNYGTRTKRASISHSKTIYQYTLDYQLVCVWSSAAEIERILHFHHSNICSCCRGRLKQCYGFIWSYIPIKPF